MQKNSDMKDDSQAGNRTFYGLMEVRVDEVGE